MEFNEEIVSPPYPNSHATIHRLRTSLCELLEWLQYHRTWANDYAAGVGSELPLVPADLDLPVVPDIDQFLSLGVADLYETYQQLRGLREYWDHTVRTYEDEWDCPQAAVHRIKAVRQGVIILVNAFVNPEKREAMDATARQQMKSAMENMIEGINSHMKSIGMPPVAFEVFGGSSQDPESTLTEDEFDALFNPIDKPDNPDDTASTDNQ